MNAPAIYCSVPRADRQLGRPGPTPWTRRPVFGAVGRMEAVRLQGEPGPGPRWWRVSFPDRLADVRSAVPSKSFGVDVRMVQPVLVWSAYADDNPSRPAEPDENAIAGLAPAAAPGLDPVELVVDGESFVVTRRADSPGTYDFDWISHPASYGFTIGANFEWRPDQAELTEQICHFLANVDPKTGYLPE
jgi:hypothetical protein